MTRRITDIVTEGEALGVVGGVAASVPVPESAADVAATPSGNLAGTTVEAQLVELDTEKASTASLGTLATQDTVSVSDVSATGTASASTYLRGDGSWSTPSGGGSAAQLVHVRDQKAAGTEGGAATAATWHVRTLNTVVTNEVTGASLASNILTLPAGTYEVEASAPAGLVSRHRVRLYDVTGTATLVVGTTEYASDDATRSWVRGRFTLAGSSQVRLDHYTQLARATNGLGVSNGVNDGEVEVYADVMIRKIS